jgi:hypothetical protein
MVKILEKMERKLGGKEFKGGSIALLYLNGRSNSAAAIHSRIYLTNTVA